MDSDLLPLLRTVLPPGFVVRQIRAEPDQPITLELDAAAPQACCPLCQQASCRVHSRYARTLHDLPWSGHPVKLLVHVRRFRCLSPGCPRVIFAERFATLTRPYGQHTSRSTDVLRTLVTALGSRGGARMAPDVQVHTSASSLRRLLGRVPVPSSGASIIGVDDFALKRGQTYGTVIVDLETHRPIELLADRTAVTLAAWLRDHPEVQLIARDRSTEYARGIQESRPEVQQVLDRWHVFKNLREVVERFLGRHQAVLRESTAPPVKRSADGELVRSENQQRREARFEQIHAMRGAGYSLRAITRELGCSRGTVKKYAHADQAPSRRRNSSRTRKIDRYLKHLQQRWEEGCRNASLLFRELRAQGYDGAPKPVMHWARERRTEVAFGTRDDLRAGVEQQQAGREMNVETELPRVVTPKALAWLIWRDPQKLSPEERAVLSTLTEKLPALASVGELTRQFVRAVREKCVQDVETWLVQAKESESREVQVFAASLERDKEALLAAVRLPWSNGPVEGVVNKIKLVKRQMFGRASFTTLRRRVLLAFNPHHQT